MIIQSIGLFTLLMLNYVGSDDTKCRSILPSLFSLMHVYYTYVQRATCKPPRRAAARAIGSVSGVNRLVMMAMLGMGRARLAPSLFALARDPSWLWLTYVRRRRWRCMVEASQRFCMYRIRTQIVLVYRILQRNDIHIHITYNIV